MALEQNTRATGAAYEPLTGAATKSVAGWIIETLLTLGTVVISPRQRMHRGIDHLLLVTRHGVVERYQRIPFDSIQRLALVHTRRRMIGAGGSLALMAVGLSLILAYQAGDGAVYGLLYLGVLTSLMGLLTFYHYVFFGPSCRLYIHTPVARYDVFCVQRMHDAHAVLDAILADVVAAQGPALTAAAMHEARLPEIAQYARPVPAGTEAVTTLHSTRMHWIFFCMLLALGASATADLFVDVVWKNTIDTIFWAVLVFVGCIAIGRQRQSDLPRDLRWLTGLTVAVEVAVYYGGSTFGTIYAMLANPVIFDPMAALDTPARIVIVGINILTGWLFGLLGVAGLLRYERSRGKGQQSPANAETSPDGE